MCEKGYSKLAFYLVTGNCRTNLSLRFERAIFRDIKSFADLKNLFSPSFNKYAAVLSAF